MAGINKENDGGSHRQDIIADCCEGEAIILIREPENRYDPNAVAPYRQSGDKIGYLPREWASDMAPRLDRGSPITAKIEALEQFESTAGNDLIGMRLELTPHKLRRKRKG